MANDPMTLERFQHLLDAHGASVARWPVADARDVSALASVSPEARVMLAEAAALDRVLVAAPGPGHRSLRPLTDQIVAGATFSSRSIGPAPSVTALQPVAKRPIGRLRWPAIAAMAASLLIGVYGGLNGWAPQALQQVAWMSADQGSNATADDESQYGDIL